MSFSFRQRVGSLDWKTISSLDVEAVVEFSRTAELQSVIDMVTFSLVNKADIKSNTVESITKLIVVMQMIIEYVLYCQESQCQLVRDLHRKCGSIRHTNKLLVKENSAIAEDNKIYQRQLALLRQSLLKTQQLVSNSRLPPRVLNHLHDGESAALKPMLESVLNHEKENQEFLRAMLDEQRGVFLKEMHRLIEKQRGATPDPVRGPTPLGETHLHPLTGSPQHTPSNRNEEIIAKELSEKICAQIEQLFGKTLDTIQQHSTAMVATMQHSNLIPPQVMSSTPHQHISHPLPNGDVVSPSQSLRQPSDRVHGQVHAQGQVQAQGQGQTQGQGGDDGVGERERELELLLDARERDHERALANLQEARDGLGKMRVDLNDAAERGKIKEEEIAELRDILREKDAQVKHGFLLQHQLSDQVRRLEGAMEKYKRFSDNTREMAIVESNLQYLSTKSRKIALVAIVRNISAARVKPVARMFLRWRALMLYLREDEQLTEHAQLLRSAASSYALKEQELLAAVRAERERCVVEQAKLHTLQRRVEVERAEWAARVGEAEAEAEALRMHQASAMPDGNRDTMDSSMNTSLDVGLGSALGFAMRGSGSGSGASPRAQGGGVSAATNTSLDFSNMLSTPSGGLRVACERGEGSWPGGGMRGAAPSTGGVLPRHPMRSSIEKELRSSLNAGLEAREGPRPIGDWDESQMASGGAGQEYAQGQGMAQGVGVRGSMGAGAMRAAMAAARERLDSLLRQGPAEALAEGEGEGEDVLMALARRRIADKLRVPGRDDATEALAGEIMERLKASRGPHPSAHR